MRTRSSGTSSSSAAICASTVRMPCPSSTLPVTIVTVPSRSRRTRRMADFSASTQNRPDDSVVRAAAAEILVEGGPYLRFRWAWVVLQKRCGAHGNAAHAEAALRRLLLDERLLHRVQLAVAAQTLHGCNLLIKHEGKRKITGGHGAAVDQHEAGAAQAAAAAEAAADQPEVVAQHVEQRRVWICLDRARDSVDLELHGSVRGDPGLANESAPSLDVVADLRRDLVRTAGRRHHALLHERFAHLRSREDRRDLLVPFLDDLGRQARRTGDPEVQVDVEVREPELREARRIGREHRAPLSRHRDYGEPARARVRQRGVHGKDRKLYLATQE